MDVYEIIYDYADEDGEYYGCHETFEGTWDDLQEYIRELRNESCYHIDANAVGIED